MVSPDSDGDRPSDPAELPVRTGIDLDEFSPGEDVPGFVVPRWRAVAGAAVERAAGSVDVPAVCLAPWRPAPDLVVDLVVERVGVGASDLVVDLGSGDGRVLVRLAVRTGCRAIGVEASARLVARSRALSRAAGVAGRVVFLHELIELRGLRGASVVYCWLLPGSAELVKGLVGEVLAGGGDLLRGLVIVGDLGDLGSLGVGEVIGEIPDQGRIRSSVGMEVKWVPVGSRPASREAG